MNLIQTKFKRRIKMHIHQTKGAVEIINGQKYELLITRQEIENRFLELALQIKENYNSIRPKQLPLLLMENLMGGSFTAKDLARALSLVGFPYHMDSVDFKRFRKNEDGRPEPRIYKNPNAETLKDRHILIVEDVIDEGITLKFAQRFLQVWQPASIKIFALGWKKEISPEFQVDYCGFILPNEWLIGEGMDDNQQERGRLGIWRKIKD